MSGAGFKGARRVRNGDLGGAARKDALIESGGHMVNEHGVWCITGYHKLGNLGVAARKDALVESEGHMVNEHGVRCITGYHKLGNLGGAGRKDALVESDGHMVNDKGVLCSIGYDELGILGSNAHRKVYEANALSEHHSHICISAICQRGASIKWENGYPVIFHHCYDPQQSGLAGQKPRQKKGLKLHICKKCHRTAKECKGAGCLAPACRNNSLKSCQHFH